MRMPSMVIDEVILLIDTYFKMCATATNDKGLQQLYCEDLSTTLRSLPFFPEFRDSPTFRNVTGMTLLMMNINNVVTHKWPINKISKAKLDVINRYQDDHILLGEVAQAIKYISTIQLESNFFLNTSGDFLGGMLLLGYHKYLETKSNLAIHTRQNLLDFKTYKCSICMDDLSFTYRFNAANLMELHFAAPIEWYTSKRSPATDQFILLCPNCHRFAHSDIGLFGEDQLRRTINL